MTKEARNLGAGNFQKKRNEYANGQATTGQYGSTGKNLKGKSDNPGEEPLPKPTGRREKY